MYFFFFLGFRGFFINYFYVLLKNPVMTTVETVSRLTIVNILLSKDDSRIPHAINTKK